MKLKVCVVGERGVGKTSLIQRYVADHFSPEYEGTLGAYLYPVEVELKGDAGEIVQARVALFDLMGEHSIRETFRDAMFYGTHGVVAVCEVGRPESLYAIADWIHAISLVVGAIPFHIAINKTDLAEDIALGPVETQWLRAEFAKARFVLTSARTGRGVEEAFTGLLYQIMGDILSAGHRRQVKRLVRQKILALVVRRGLAGVSKNDLLINFKELEYSELMEEVENLQRLGMLDREELGPNAFRLRATPRGQEIAASTLWEELVVDEPV